MLFTLLLTLAAHAGEMKVTGEPGAGFRRLFAVCDSQDPKCAAGKCKMNVSELKCERVPETLKGSCTFKCSGSEHMLTGDQALAVFKTVEKQKKMVEKTESTETFKDASIICDAMKVETSGTCRIKHAKIK